MAWRASRTSGPMNPCGVQSCWTERSSTDDMLLLGGRVRTKEGPGEAPRLGRGPAGRRCCYGVALEAGVRQAGDHEARVPAVGAHVRVAEQSSLVRVDARHPPDRQTVTRDEVPVRRREQPHVRLVHAE